MVTSISAHGVLLICKGFDSAPVNRVLAKLGAYHIQGITLLQWLCAFIIYANNVLSVVKFKVKIFADNVTLFTAVKM